MAGDDLSRFEAGSIRFAFPSNWTREVEESEEGFSVVLQSAGVTFAIVGVYDASEEPEDLVEQALESLREEHPSLETDELEEGVDWEDSAGVEAVFMSLDTISYGWLQSGRVGERSVLVFMQSIEPEARQSEAVFRAICASVEPVDD